MEQLVTIEDLLEKVKVVLLEIIEQAHDTNQALSYSIYLRDLLALQLSIEYEYTELSSASKAEA